MKKFYSIIIGGNVTVREYEGCCVGVDLQPVKKSFFQGLAIVDSKKQQHEVALVPHAGMKSLTLSSS